jgi:hypothetical protein
MGSGNDYGGKMKLHRNQMTALDMFITWLCLTTVVVTLLLVVMTEMR